MDNARESFSNPVKQFLASNLSASSSRADIVFKELSVEGSGRGVTTIRVTIPGIRHSFADFQTPGSSSTNRLDQNRIMAQHRQPARIPPPRTLSNSAAWFLRHLGRRGDVARHRKTRQRLHNISQGSCQHAGRVQGHDWHFDLRRSSCR